MSSGCGNCDCADKSQCTKKGNTFGLEIVVETNYNGINFQYENMDAENDCKCGPSCNCNGCTCHN
uniref:Metallothionein-like protein n=1 Tax=Picea sitchensis TaxID=3332 RepID=A9NLT7_PICSI|nr:unknown [Picea sitchensis]